MKCGNCGYKYAKAGYNCPACGHKVKDEVADFIFIVVIVTILLLVLVAGPGYLLYKAYKEPEKPKNNWWLLSAILSSVLFIYGSTYFGESKDWGWLGLTIMFGNITTLLTSLVIFFIRLKSENYKIEMLFRKNDNEVVATSEQEPSINYKEDLTSVVQDIESEEELTKRGKKKQEFKELQNIQNRTKKSTVWWKFAIAFFLLVFMIAAGIAGFIWEKSNDEKKLLIDSEKNRIASVLATVSEYVERKDYGSALVALNNISWQFKPEENTQLVEQYLSERDSLKQVISPLKNQQDSLKNIAYSLARTIEISDSLNQVKIGLIENYFLDLENKTLDAHKYFANRVKQYYTKHDMTPDGINIDLQKYYEEFIHAHHEIDQSSVINDTANNMISFSNDFTCYRQSKRKSQSCTVFTEFLFNDSMKILSIREPKIQDLKYF